MCKQFGVEPGFLVRVGGLWHDSNVRLFVEEDERAEVYVSTNGQAGSCLGVYACAELDQSARPLGLGRSVGRRGTIGPAATLISHVDYRIPAWTAALSGPCIAAVACAS